MLNRPTFYVLSLQLAILFLLLPSTSIANDAAVDRRVVITIDDLPYVGSSNNLNEATFVTRSICEALTKHEAPSSGFVNGGLVMKTGEVDARLDLLRQYRDCAMDLENHSYSHGSFHKLDLTEYLDDVTRGELFPRLIMNEVGKQPRYYRHPFNHAGKSAEDREAFADFLAERGVELTPFTVEHADYLFNRLYQDAEARKDEEAMQKVRRAYLDQLDIAFDFAEALSRDTFGREIPQIFLIHSNKINALELANSLDRLVERGYRFISLSEALEDPAFATPNLYAGKAGISWLHRFRVGMDKENRLREEPDPPRWALDAYRALTE